MPLEIVDFEDRHAGAWRDLNVAWIRSMFALEPKDMVVLNEPQGKVIEPGGHILIAELDGKPVGCCALIPLHEGDGFELAKMACVEALRGHGVGKALMQACTDKARAEGARRVYLETNSACLAAIGLYEAFGFRHLAQQEHPPTEYARADVFMELRL